MLATDPSTILEIRDPRPEKPGGGTIDEKRERLEKIISLQRDMLARHVGKDVPAVPQIFCPYKEVLDIYRSGMALPDDITIVWPDDNFGYIRQLPDDAERRRGGGHGIYYHLSYWGRPHDYLWLESTSPALVWHEMTKAHELGADRLWVVNVGDIKPIEAGLLDRERVNRELGTTTIVITHNARHFVPIARIARRRGVLRYV